MAYFKRDHMFKFDYWLVPVHLGAHWAMMVNMPYVCAQEIAKVCMTTMCLVNRLLILPRGFYGTVIQWIAVVGYRFLKK